MKIKTIVTALCSMLSLSLWGQTYQGTYEHRNFKCPIANTSEGYLHTSDGGRIDIVSHVALADGEYIHIMAGKWGKKECQGAHYKVYYIDRIQRTQMQQRLTEIDHRYIPSAAGKGETESTIYPDYYKDRNETDNPYSYDVSDMDNQSSTKRRAISHTGSKVSIAEAEEALAFHNKARKDVGVAPLVWSTEISMYAQEWADYLAQGCSMQHRSSLGKNDRHYGENLFIGWGTVYTAAQASESWYSEIEDYVYGTYQRRGSHQPVVGHYTQMVWNKSTAMGMGVARCSDGTYIIVANYDPPGNYIGQYPY